MSMSFVAEERTADYTRSAPRAGRFDRERFALLLLPVIFARTRLADDPSIALVIEIGHVEGFEASGFDHFRKDFLLDLLSYSVVIIAINQQRFVIWITYGALDFYHLRFHDFFLI